MICYEDMKLTWIDDKIVTNETWYRYNMSFAKFDLQEVNRGHLIPKIYGATDISATILQIGVQKRNFQGILFILWWFKADMEPLWLWPYLTLEGHKRSG